MSGTKCEATYEHGNDQYQCKRCGYYWDRGDDAPECKTNDEIATK